MKKFALIFALILFVGCANAYPYKYNDRVVITNGFYLGQRGVIVGQHSSARFNVELEDGKEITVWGNSLKYDQVEKE